MAERKAFDWQVLLVVLGVLVGIIVLLRLVLARSSAVVVQERQSNPLIAAIDAAPAFVKAMGGFVGGIFQENKVDPSGISSYDTDYVTSLEEWLP